jgi:hypothetical protein
VGDGKLAARATRARSAAAGEFSWCPLPQVPRAAGAFATALEAIWRGDHALRTGVREGPQGQAELSAEGEEYPLALSPQGHEQMCHWPARRLVGRSVQHAPAAAALRARVAKAIAPSEALNQRGRGTKRCETRAALRQAVSTLRQR